MTKKDPQPFLDLKELSKKIHTYNSILHLLHWDMETHMPVGSISPRSEQIALLSSLIHEEKTSLQYKRLLEKLIHIPSGKPKLKGLSKVQLATLREWHKDFNRNTKLPPEFIKTFSQVTSEASQIWASAKKENNFKLFAPFLEKIIDLCRKKADMLGFEDHPYDALLEAYEPCMTTRKLDQIFSSLKEELIALLKKIKKKPLIKDRFLHTKINDETQIAISKRLLANLPIEPSYTRLDISSHPFSIALHPHDSRITTGILPNAFMSNIFSILHETGHSFYEMGLPLAHFGTPLCEATSLSVHESQSRFWETLVGRSLPFWTHFYKELKKEIPKQLKNIPLKQFYHAINRVAPSCIRVEADEVTYCLHVILRFEIEKQLIQGTLQVVDLPAAWNAKMKEFFGITPANDSMGCLQDIHWSLGDFGYFPTYALGNILAAQFFTTFSKDNPEWEEKMATGDLGFVKDWLKTNIHQWGKMYDAEQLVKKVTGKALSEKPYCDYLKKKYKDLYNL